MKCLSGLAQVARKPLLLLFLTMFIAPLCTRLVCAQDKPPAWTAQEQPIVAQIKSLRSLPDDVRAKTTKDAALEIRALPPSSPGKLRLAEYLASRATEGDFGPGTLQEVTNTLSQALQQQPPPEKDSQPAGGYVALAELARYEHMQVSCDNPQYKAATAKLEADDIKRQDANFTLTDMQGKSWTLKDLKGKVVMVNFWATWCPPCVEETPSLEKLSSDLRKLGVEVIGVSVDRDPAALKKFISDNHLSFPIARDPDQAVASTYGTFQFPETYILDREGRVAEKIIGARDWGDPLMLSFVDSLARGGRSPKE